MSSAYTYAGPVDLARMAVRTYPAPLSLAAASGLAEIGGSSSDVVSRDIAGLVNRGWLSFENSEVTATEKLVASAQDLKITELEKLVGG